MAQFLHFKGVRNFVTHFTALLALFSLVISCSKMNKARDLFTTPTAREQYERDFDSDPAAYGQWKKTFENALFDSITVTPPYFEAGKFTAPKNQIYTYNISLNPGEQLRTQVQTDSLNPLVFIDLYRQKTDSVASYEHVKSADFGDTEIQFETEQPGIYKILLQPEINSTSAFSIKIFTEPVYSFPVANRGNTAVQSMWGATRDGGRRSHEGIDIFAPRGTPVVAATSGRVSSTGNKGLGGKQVWLRDTKRGNSLYYAHLDSIIARPGMRVKVGDTLGLVGNTAMHAPLRRTCISAFIKAIEAHRIHYPTFLNPRLPTNLFRSLIRHSCGQPVRLT
ncbi:M23 family metallopeptidase [Salinimicrobium sp. MT39]|uniref:M23 family metallopeptidase n=1 Tax=Salinimicrobium profundisediminis TaxID=2994553 RepID=A0A9X3CY40_9FLAO|nr:M23 family metallopeptidase [Salinimicrobium profundisediminis]MCX2838728.1 M23 family metallopeptidase [Salinimicrobium profundisediminis]